MLEARAQYHGSRKHTVLYTLYGGDALAYPPTRPPALPPSADRCGSVAVRYGVRLLGVVVMGCWLAARFGLA